MTDFNNHVFRGTLEELSKHQTEIEKDGWTVVSTSQHGERLVYSQAPYETFPQQDYLITSKKESS